MWIFRATVDIFSVAKAGKKDVVIFLTYFFTIMNELTYINGFSLVVGGTGRCQNGNGSFGTVMVQSRGRSERPENGKSLFRMFTNIHYSFIYFSIWLKRKVWASVQRCWSSSSILPNYCRYERKKINHSCFELIEIGSNRMHEQLRNRILTWWPTSACGANRLPFECAHPILSGRKRSPF